MLAVRNLLTARSIGKVVIIWKTPLKACKRQVYEYVTIREGAGMCRYDLDESLANEI